MKTTASPSTTQILKFHLHKLHNCMYNFFPVTKKCFTRTWCTFLFIQSIYFVILAHKRASAIRNSKSHIFFLSRSLQLCILHLATCPWLYVLSSSKPTARVSQRMSNEDSVKQFSLALYAHMAHGHCS